MDATFLCVNYYNNATNEMSWLSVAYNCKCLHVN